MDKRHGIAIPRFRPEIKVRYDMIDSYWTWDQFQEYLEQHQEYRPPTLLEATMITFDADNVWISKMIEQKHCVVDRDWGIQTVTDGVSAGILLIIKEKDE